MPLHKVTCVPRGHALGVVRADGNPPGLKTILILAFIRLPNFLKMTGIQ